MIDLPHSCCCTELKVNPKNWQTNKNAVKKNWFIYYRFYDPVFRSKSIYPKGKLVVVKGMNHLDDSDLRIAKTKELIEAELNKLKNININIPARQVNQIVIDEIDSSTCFNEAITIAEKRIIGAPSTKSDLKWIVQLIKSYADKLCFSQQPISSVSRKHIKHMLLLIDTSMGESAHRFNNIRSYLMMIYNELIELEVVESNPMRDISKRKTIHRLRNVPSKNSRKEINDYLKKNYYQFWLFMQIFFHSGSRLTEMINLKKHDVDLENQMFRVIIKKGKQYKEVNKPIKNIAFKFWQEVLIKAGNDDYLFSRGLLPGPYRIKSYQITKRWYRLVKKKLGVQYDFYSLKHLNLDETAELMGLSDAAAMASHSSIEITRKHYTINESKREFERLKQVSNEFSH
jgi:integrase